jgi:hypothetical protein
MVRGCSPSWLGAACIVMSEPMVSVPDFESILADIQVQRARKRSPLVFGAVIAGGFLAAAVGVVLAIPLPEAGIPLLLVGLRLLALRFAWAAVAYAHVRWRWLRLRAWWRTKPRWLREVVLWGSIILVLALLSLIR